MGIALAASVLVLVALESLEALPNLSVAADAIADAVVADAVGVVDVGGFVVEATEVADDVVLAHSNAFSFLPWVLETILAAPLKVQLLWASVLPDSPRYANSSSCFESIQV